MMKMKGMMVRRTMLTSMRMRETMLATMLTTMMMRSMRSIGMGRTEADLSLKRGYFSLLKVSGSGDDGCGVE